MRLSFWHRRKPRNWLELDPDELKRRHLFSFALLGYTSRAVDELPVVDFYALVAGIERMHRQCRWR